MTTIILSLSPMIEPLPNSERLERLAEEGERFYAEQLRDALEPE
jgi:hypothetical protein